MMTRSYVVMRKRNLVPMAKKTAQSALALSLAATMAIPGGVSVAAATTTEESTVTVPQPIKVYDFNNGLQGIADDDAKFSITKSEEIYFQKDESEVDGKSEKVDANGLVYTGGGADMKYHKGLVSNQPTTAYDEEKGTVLQIGKTYTIPAIEKSQSAAIEGDADGTNALDKQIPVGVTEGIHTDASGTSVTIQKEYTATSEIVVSNPFGSSELAKELEEYDELDDVKSIKVGTKYTPLWTKGVTFSYWIKVPADEEGNYKPSSALRWELDDQIYYQSDDLAKYMPCKKFHVDQESWSDEERESALKNESKVNYTSEFYFQYLETDGVDEDGAPKARMHTDASATKGPVYDARFISSSFYPSNEKDDIFKSRFYFCSPHYIQGFQIKSDGSYDKLFQEAHYRKGFNTLDIEDGSMVRRAYVDGELQIDVDNSIFWVPDNNVGVNINPNRTDTYGIKGGMHNADVFFMNSWQESGKANKYGDGTYASALTTALSPVTSLDESGNGVKNGNTDTWHQVTVTMQNDWVEFYVDGECAEVSDTYSSRGALTLDTKKSFKRLNKGAGLRGGWGSEKDFGNIAYANYVCRLLMDWITDEEATLHIGGAGQYAKEYAQSTTSCEFSIDDLKFYDQLLTKDQIVAAYDNEVADMEKTADITADATKIDMTAVSDASVGINAAAAQVVEAKINDKAVSAVKVSANEKAGTTTAAKYANPFAGKNLEGATVAYWVKQSTADRTTVLSFVDAEKDIFNPKEPDTTEKASSILYVKNTGESMYQEGFLSAAVTSKLKNSYMTAPSATDAAVMLNNSTEWQYVTATMTNAGIKYYINGELVENKAANPMGVRFFDGYYQRLKDEESTMTRNGIFGATNNQGCTQLMTFLTYEDTSLYLGYLPQSGGLAQEKTAEATFANIKTFDQELTAEQVKDLFDNALNDDVSTLKKGDINGDDDITLDDAQIALRAALRIVTDLTDAQKTAADVNGDGDITLDDAQLILRFALRIITTW